MTRFFILTVILTLACTSGYAEEITSDTESRSKYYRISTKRYSNYLGLVGGFISGNGLAYRRWINDNIGFQLNAFPLYREQVYPEDEYNYEIRDSGYYNTGTINYGGLLLVKLADVHYLRFVTYTGCNHTIHLEEANYYVTERIWEPIINDNITRVKQIRIDKRRNTLSGGVGAGAEFYVFCFGFNLMFGFQGSYCFEDRTKTVSPSIDGGVFFRF